MKQLACIVLAFALVFTACSSEKEEDKSDEKENTEAPVDTIQEGENIAYGWADKDFDQVEVTLLKTEDEESTAIVDISKFEAEGTRGYVFINLESKTPEEGMKFHPHDMVSGVISDINEYFGIKGSMEDISN